MYILRVKYNDNVIIPDLGVIVMPNDKDGTFVEKEKFNQSLDAKQVLDKLIIESSEGDYSELPEKNVIDSENLLTKIQGLYPDMTVYIRNYGNSGQPAIAMYINSEWKIISGGSGEGGGGGMLPGYLAKNLSTDSDHRLVTDSQINVWNNKSSFSGNYNDLADRPNLATVATSGNYEDLTNKPTMPTKTSQLEKDDIYTKSEIDSKIVASTSGISRYQAIGSTDGSCYVVATGSGVTFNKTANSCQLVVPNGVQLLSAQIHFAATEIGSTGNCIIDYGMGSDYTNIVIPQFQVVNDVPASRAYKIAPSPAANLNTSAHTLQLTGLTNIAIWVKLQF